MAIDRVALIRNAENFLRQGKLDQAIAVYRRIVDDQPRDWNTANLLGDLYLQAGQIDTAVTEYRRVADSLSQEGFLAKAGAIYRKILKTHPHDEHALLRAADIAAAQKLVVDARAHLNTVYEQRRDRGDMAGAQEIIVRIAALDPEAALSSRLAHIESQVSGSRDAQPEDDRLPVDVELPAVVEPATGKTARVDVPAEDEIIETAPMVSPSPPQPAPRDLDDFFSDLREEAALRSTKKEPEEELSIGLAFYDAGELDLAVPRLEAASRAPACRFTATATLGRICVGRGDAWQAIEWFERAAEAPAPTSSEGHRLFYELADALEGVGEVARALAVCLELQAEAGDFKDVAARIDRLTKVQAGG